MTVPPAPDRKTQIVRFAIGASFALLIGILIVAIIYGTASIRQVRSTQVDHSPQVESNAETLARVEACTTPGRPCYERGQRQIADAVSTVDRVVVIAAACASGSEPRTAARIEACVLHRLAAERHHR